MRCNLLRTVRALPRIPLSHIDPPAMPGCYLQFLSNNAPAGSVGFLAAIRLAWRQGAHRCVVIGRYAASP
jgi:hypothetical protein